MSKELTTIKQTEAIEKFNMLLNREPAKKQVKVNKFADGAKYLPIRFLEQKLDELFFGLWRSEVTDTKVVGNEYVVTVQVSYFHPVASQWISRTGVGSVPIQQKKGAAITDLDAKYINALQKNAPAAKAFAFKNAVKSIGPIFGRNLNTNEEDLPDYQPGTTQAIIVESQLDKVKKGIEAAPNEDALSNIFKQHHKMPGVPQMIMEKRKELSQKTAA